MNERGFIRAQPGFQENFLGSGADIVIGGGAAGAGKSYALLMESLRHTGNGGFRAAIFRRTTPQIKNAGGLWDTSKELFRKLSDARGQKAVSTEQPPKWTFPSGATLLFSHLEHESDKYSWDGAQVAMLGFDELVHFTESQFWYMVGRNRSSSGVRPYIRATTNPQSSGWVKRLISWWLYPDDFEREELRGMPISGRVGISRFLARYNEQLYWGDTAEDAIDALPEDARGEYSVQLVKSVTFVPGVLAENVELTGKDPGYKGNLLSQDKRHGTRLLRGCWYDADGENDLFRYVDLWDLFGNDHLPGGQKYLTADVAMEGSDRFRVGIWSGLRLEKIYSWDRSDGELVWREMERLAAENGVWGQHIVFDANGVGNFLKGFFRSAYDFRSQGSCVELQGVKANFRDLRTQCAFKLADLVSEHGLFIRAAGQERDAIIEEFENHKKTGSNPSGRLTITAKEEVKTTIRRSPDYFDMILMRMVFELAGTRRNSYLTEE